MLAVALLANTVAPHIASAQNGPSAGVAAISGDEATRKGAEALNRKDYASALNWFQKGADQRNAVAQFNIGWMYRDGLGVKQDYGQAIGWFEKAAAQGNAPAQDVIGKMYHDGLGVKQDYAAAMDWSLKAANQGQMSAQLRIASMYMAGEGVKEDSPSALTWFLKVAEGDPARQVGIDAETAKGWKAEAQFVVGRMYEAGTGAAKDTAQAAKWYRSATRLGSAKARTKLAELQVPADTFDIVLSCEMGTPLRGNIKTLVSIDTKSKYIRVEIPAQGTLEFRDGVYGEEITSGYMAKPNFNTISNESF